MRMIEDFFSSTWFVALLKLRLVLLTLIYKNALQFKKKETIYYNNILQNKISFIILYKCLF
jgi:hypothetical protein